MVTFSHMRDFDDIVSFYITSFLIALQNNSTCDEEFFIGMNNEYAFKSLEIFRLALYWEIEKAMDMWKEGSSFEIEDDLILDYIREYPPELTDRYQYLGKNWYNIANLVLSADKHNIVQTIDSLVDIEHNNGNVLNRVVHNHKKYMDFLTCKTHAKDIRELLPYCDDPFIKKTAIRTVKANGLLTPEFEDGYTDFLTTLYVNLVEYEGSKERDLENIKTKLEMVKFYGVTNTFKMIAENQYCFGGEFTACNAYMETIDSSVIKSGKFENCYIKNTKINNGYFKNCVIENCDIEFSPTFLNSFIMSSTIQYNSCAVLDNVAVTDVELYSEDITIVNSSEIDVNLLA
jgi:hypothetical protein